MFSRRRKDQLIGDLVPIEDHLTDHQVILSDGSILAMFAVEGVPWETVDADVLIGAHSGLNETIRNIATEQLIISTYKCRGLADPGEYPRGKFRSGFAETLDLLYRERLYDRALYKNKLFIELQIRPPNPAGEWIGDVFEKRARKIEEAPEARMERLRHVCALLKARLRPYGPRQLGLVERSHQVFSEIAETIAYATTGIWRPVPWTTGRLGNVMFSEDITFGHEAIEMRGPGHQVFAAMLGLREYPAMTWPGLFNALLAAPFRLTLKQSFLCLSKSDGQAILTRKQNKMVWAGDKAFSQIDGLSRAADRLASNEFIMGEHNLSLCVFATSAKALNEVATEAWKTLADSGAVVAREGRALMAAWLSQIPGNHRVRVRPGAISSRNYAGMAPLQNYPPGAKKGYWGAPIAMFRTSGGTPYLFHLHVNDLGNCFVSGRAGSGKTTWLGWIVTQAEKAGAQTIIWDKDRGLEVLSRAVGGSYLRLRNGEPLLAPLKALDGTNPSDVTFLTRLARGAILHRAGDNAEITPEEDRRLAIGIREVMRSPPEERWWGEVRAFLGTSENGAGARLEKWCWGNELGWVMDAPKHLVSLNAPVVGFDQTQILDNEDARGPTLAILFHQCESLLDGRRVLFVLDEVWKSLLEPAFKDIIHDGLKTFRKRGAPMILATQSPRDALRTDIAHTLKEQTPTQVYFANPSADWKDYGEDGMNRSRAEFEIIRRLPEGTGVFLLCQGNRSVVAQLPLDGLDDEIAVISGREETVRLLDAMPPETLNDPTKMLPEFHAKRKELART